MKVIVDAQCWSAAYSMLFDAAAAFEFDLLSFGFR
jgi:hypothetical protein